MTQYIRQPVTVDAVQFNFQRLEDLPDWLTKHSAYTAMGTQHVGKDAVGQLLIPINGVIVTVKGDDYIVRIPRGDEAEIAVLKPAAFEADYTPVGGKVVIPAEDAAVVEPAPAAEEPQAEPSSGGKGKGKATSEPETPAAAEASTPEA